ncbi:MAG TPA: thioesterase family protein [Candidatus Acidoferrales bacterium]|nr:thioesterase family protein [Candidatus Acidoferrales bacterium]HTX56581.1 thioesterase family protein [Candidatus Acidoferrales bacterium]
MLEAFKLVTRFTIPFSDIDMLQHVNNLAYIRWCETVRTEYFARVMKADITSERGMIQANINFTYEKQLHYREPIAVGVRISRIGTKSLDFSYEIWSEAREHRAAHGITTVVAYDFVNNRTIEISPAWRAAIASFEEGPQQSFI